MKQKEKRASADTIMKLKIVSEPFSKFYSNRNRLFVKALCECGKEIEMIYSPISKSYPKSCGCSKLVFKDKAKTYKMRLSYRSMKNRCYDSTHKAYKWYGGKGIAVCDRWLNGFKYFFEDMESTWFSGGQIDRFPDLLGNYEKNNCRWATSAEQNRNKKNIKLNIESVEFIRTSNLKQSDLAIKFQVKENTISRVKNFKRWK